MSVIINAETGNAEDLPEDQASQALTAGTHHVALNDPQGNPVTAPIDQARDLISQGYSQPTQAQYQNLLDAAKQNTPGGAGQQFLRGVGKGMTFGQSTSAELAAGESAKDIRQGEQAHPIADMAGQMTGLVGSSFIPLVGEANILTKAGALAAKVAGLSEGTGIAARVGSAALKGFIENTMVATGDEVSRMYVQDGPGSAETAIADIGLAGLFGGVVGGGFGAISPLWKAASETKLGQWLGIMKAKANGEGPPPPPLPPGHPDIQTFMPVSVDALAERAGITIPPELKAKIEGSPQTRELYRLLMESGTRSGEETQVGHKKFLIAAHDAILDALGTNKQTIDGLDEYSQGDMGKALMDELVQSIREQNTPIADEFAQIKEQSGHLPFNDAKKSALIESITKKGNEEGWDLKGTPQNRLFQLITGEWLPEAKDLRKLRSIYSAVNQQTEDPKLQRMGIELTGMLRGADDDIVEGYMHATTPPPVPGSPEELAALADRASAPEGIDLKPDSRITRARLAYNDVMTTIEELNKRAHVGAYAGPESFLTNLQKQKPEELLRRLTPVQDTDLIDVMGGKLPGATDIIKEAYISRALKAAGAKASDPYAINMNTLFAHLDKWSPELRQFALPEGAAEQLDAVRSLLDAGAHEKNSLTARNTDSMWSKIPGAAMAMASLITGHNPVMGYFMGQGTRYIGRELPDAMNLAFLKFLGNGNPVEASAFKTAVDFSHAVIQGESKLNRAVKGVFKAGREVLPQGFPTEKTRDKIKTHITSLDADNSSLMAVGGNTGYYLPEQGAGLGAVAARATQVLSQLKPDTTKMGPLDPERIPSPGEEDTYNDAIDIAQQPLVALAKLKDGMLTPQDVAVFQQIYPALYERTSDKLMQEVIAATAKGDDLPHDVQMQLTMFLGHPLDSAMSQTSIAASQPLPQQPLTQAHNTEAGHHEKFKALGNLSTTYQTAGEKRQASKNQA